VARSDELDEHFEAWAEALDDEEIESQRNYQGRNFEIINRFFRDPDGTAVALSDTAFMVIEEVSARLDSAIAKGWLFEDVLAYRGMKSYAALFGTRAPEDLVGFEFREDSYVSTSIDEYRARRFLDEENGFMLTFVAPWRSHAAWLPAVGLPEFETQRELLLPRGMRFRVIAVEDRGGILWVTAEIAPRP
jgi:hypothetical protein